MLCRVRVPRILIVLKGSQHGTHERYCLIDQGMGSRRARVRWSLRSDTHWPRVARPPPQSRDSASSTAASPRSAKKARHRPASSAASSAAHRKHLRPASERRASSRAPSSSLHSSSVCQTPIGSPANQAGSGDPRRPLQGCCCSATATSSRAERELVPLQRRLRAHGHDQRPAADVAARRTLPRCALTWPSVARRCRTGT